MINTGENISKTEFVELLTLAVEGLISKEQFALVQKQIVNNKDAEELYYDFLATYVGLSHYGKFASSSLNRPEPESEFDALLGLLASQERTAPTAEIDTPEDPESEFESVQETVRVKRHKSRFSLYIITLSAAATLLFAITAILSPARPVIGVLTDSINAKWISEDGIPVKGAVVRQGEVTLAGGLAEITFDYGAVVVVEAPAVIRFEGPQSMYLAGGKISAFVPEYASGFTVNTPNARIVDLGTEFGVVVEGDNSSSLHMFNGQARLITGPEGPKKINRTVNANEARNVDFMTGVVKDVQMGKRSFVRHIDSDKGFIWHGENLNVADIVGGGDGLGKGRLNSGVRVFTGKYQRDILPNPGSMPIRVTEDNYKVTSHFKYIDGVFTPFASESPITVSSADDAFKFPSQMTSENFGIVANYSSSTRMRQLPAVLNGIEYGSLGRPVIMMRRNVGITFDLDAIRKDFVGMRISGFKALCGLSESDLTGKPSNANFYVLVDGKMRFSKIGASASDGGFPVKVDLNENDRFLTLAAAFIEFGMLIVPKRSQFVLFFHCIILYSVELA